MSKKKVLLGKSDSKPQPPLIWLSVDTIFPGPHFYATIREFLVTDAERRPNDPLATQLVESLFRSSLVNSISVEGDVLELGLVYFPLRDRQLKSVVNVFYRHGLTVRAAVLIHRNGNPVLLFG